MGVRPIDAGPLTMGQRVSNEKTGNVPGPDLQQRRLCAAHAGDDVLDAEGRRESAFKHSMQQFVKEYCGKAATTEDWKAI
jgi:hypothetical protein